MAEGGRGPPAYKFTAVARGVDCIGGKLFEAVSGVTGPVATNPGGRPATGVTLGGGATAALALWTPWNDPGIPAAPFMDSGIGTNARAAGGSVPAMTASLAAWGMGPGRGSMPMEG